MSKGKSSTVFICISKLTLSRVKHIDFVSFERFLACACFQLCRRLANSSAALLAAEEALLKAAAVKISVKKQIPLLESERTT